MQVTPEGLAWFQDARFGMFVHWGLYALLGRGEWVMHNEQIPVPAYEPLMRRFNPSRFDADAWVALAAEAGQRYLVVTSRHHDGFSMYDTALSDYKVTNTPFGRDPLRDLADACARRGDVKLGFYVSLLDWRHPAYRFRAASGLAWDDYLGFLHGQVRELCTQYGELACIWFDGDWPHGDPTPATAYFTPGGSFEYGKLYAMIHTLQPHAVVLNNRHAQPLPGEDIQGFEQDLPGENTAGFNVSRPTGLPLEVCMTINESWGVATDDANHKSARRLLHYLVRAASAGANYLLNVGPTAEGEILPVHAQRLRALGAWLAQNGASIYGTQAGSIAPAADGAAVCTRRGATHYVHALHYHSDCLTLRDVPAELTRARLLATGQPLDLARRGERVLVRIPEELRDPLDTVVVLDPADQ